MVRTGICRHMDAFGRVVLPSKLREAYGVVPGARVEFLVDEQAGCIALRCFQSGCVFCSSHSEPMLRIENYLVCATCMQDAAARVEHGLAPDPVL